MNDSNTTERAPNAKRVLEQQLRPGSLSNSMLIQVQIELLSSVLERKKVSLYDAPSAVPETFLLTGVTREVERRTQDSYSFFNRIFGRKDYAEWDQHAKRVTEIENRIAILVTNQLP